MKIRGILAVLALVCSAAHGAAAQSIIEDWGLATAPPAPVAQTVTLDPKTTAFLALDFTGGDDPKKGPCNITRPRCMSSLPAVKKMLTAARAAGVLIVYSVTTAGGPEDIDHYIAPQPGDPVVKSGPDKFIGTDLAQILASHGIKTVVVTGTAAEGAVMQTVTDAVMREGLKAVVPVAGMSSSLLYNEQYVAWYFLNAPGMKGKVVLTQRRLMSY
ncbi:MAG: isochorismatase family protein [Acidocella sp.]|nr:isochorismatase family protein [Acidocella sp.]